MPRQHRRKTTRWINEDCMQLAVRDICEGLETPSTAARKYGLKRTTIIYRVEKKQKMELISRNKEVKNEEIAPPLLSEIFSVTQEKELMGYLNRYTYLPYDSSGSYKAARQLVYQFVKEHDIKHPKTWDTDQQAGVAWLKGFIQRNPETNLRNSANATTNTNSESANNSSLHCDEKRISLKKKSKTESIAQPALKKKSIHPVAVLSEQSLESNNSFANSFQSYVESTNLPTSRQLQLSDSCDADDMDEDSPGLDIEPECHITMVAIKNEPTDNPTVAGGDHGNSNNTFDRDGDLSIGGSKTNFIPNLDTVPENDDVFNSFGRNIAFQAKELFQHSQIDALELMHEVQTLVNRRLTSMLRLKNTNGRKTQAIRLRRLLEDDNLSS